MFNFSKALAKYAPFLPVFQGLSCFSRQTFPFGRKGAFCDRFIFYSWLQSQPIRDPIFGPMFCTKRLSNCGGRDCTGVGHQFLYRHCHVRQKSTSAAPPAASEKPRQHPGALRLFSPSLSGSSRRFGRRRHHRQHQSNRNPRPGGTGPAKQSDKAPSPSSGRAV